MARPVIKAVGDGSVGGYFFYDINGKINHKFSDKSRLFISAYTGKDKAYYRYDDEYTYDGVKYRQKYDNNLLWGNFIAAIRWNYIISPKLFMDTTTTYSRYKFNVGLDYEDAQSGPGVDETSAFNFDYLSGINDWSGKLDFDYSPNADHSIRFGTGYIYHSFKPGVNELSVRDGNSTMDSSYGSNFQYAHEMYLYAEDDFNISKRLKANLGVHFSGFYVQNKLYHSLQPRASLRYKLNETSSIKASYARMTQYVHLLSNQSIGLPTDLWVPVTDTIPPQQSDQVALGYARTIKKDYELSAEVYYKTSKFSWR